MKVVHILCVLFSVAVFAQPYEPHVLWDRSGQTDSSAYGYMILPLGDQNSDGFADFAVLAHGNMATTYHGSQRAYMEFFHGGLTPDTVPYFVFQQDSPAYYQSWSASVVGDLNGDGYKDWMTEYWPQGFPPYRIEGIFYGGNEPSGTPDLAWSVSVVSGFYWIDDFNFNGDGFDDLFWINNETGEARIYFGGNPLDTLPDWTLYEPPSGQIQSYPQAIGDFNGDGSSDFIIYNPNNGNLDIFLGGTNPDTVPDYLWTDMMWPIGGVNSLNGDAADEFVLGSGVYFGRDFLHTTPDYVLNSQASHQAVSAGDFNHDSYKDLILFVGRVGTDFGRLEMYLGHPWLNLDPVFTIEGTWPSGLVGIYAAAGLGDVNGDGIDDFAIGAWDDLPYLGWRGRCVVISGDTLTVSANEPQAPLPVELSVNAYPNPFNSETTIRVSAPVSAQSVTLSVYNVLGQEVRHEILPPFSQKHFYRFGASDLTTGIYFVHVQSGNLSAIQKLMLLR